MPQASGDDHGGALSWDWHDRRAHGEGTARFGPPPGVTLYVPVVVAFLIQVPVAMAVVFWTGTPRPLGALSVALAAASALALLAARRWPGPTVAVVAALTTAALFVPPDAGPPFIALAFAIIGSVVRGARLWALIAVGAGWLIAVVGGSLVGVAWHPFRVALTTLGLAFCFVIGEGIRTRIDRAAAYRARLAQRRASAEEAERMRIARELHDVLAHSLSQISVQSGVGLHLFDREPEKAREALAAIRTLSTTGLDEVRGVLGFLRGDESAPITPQPQLADLGALANSRSDLGLVIELRDGLAPHDAPPSAVQSAAYRIAQEALTNVVRHSGATQAVIALSRDRDALVIVVEDDGTGMPQPTTTVGGGIRGMRERAELAGGTLEIGPGISGGTRVAARLPWRGSEDTT